MPSGPAVLSPEDVEIEQPKALSLDASDVEFEQPKNLSPTDQANAELAKQGLSVQPPPSRFPTPQEVPTLGVDVPAGQEKNVTGALKDVYSGYAEAAPTALGAEGYKRAYGGLRKLGEAADIDAVHQAQNEVARREGKPIPSGFRASAEGTRAEGLADIAQGANQALTPAYGIAGLENPIGIGKGLLEASVASELARKVAEGANLSDDEQRLASELGFIAPMAAHSAGTLFPEVAPGVRGASVKAGPFEAGAVQTPGTYEAAIKLGASKLSARILRTPEPSATEVSQRQTVQQGVQAMLEANAVDAQAARVANGQPAVEPPPKPPIVNDQQVKDRAQQIRSLPKEVQPEAIAQSHQELSQRLAEQGVHVNGDGTVEPVTSPKAAAKVAADIINKEAENEKPSTEVQPVAAEPPRPEAQAQPQELLASAVERESDLEQARRGAGEPQAEELPVNQVPVEQRPSTTIPQEAEGRLAQRLENRNLAQGDTVQLATGDTGKVAYIPASGKRIPVTLENGKTKWTMRDAVTPISELKPEEVEHESTAAQGQEATTEAARKAGIESTPAQSEQDIQAQAEQMRMHLDEIAEHDPDLAKQIEAQHPEVKEILAKARELASNKESHVARGNERAVSEAPARTEGEVREISEGSGNGRGVSEEPGEDVDALKRRVAELEAKVSGKPAPKFTVKKADIVPTEEGSYEARPRESTPTEPGPLVIKNLKGETVKTIPNELPQKATNLPEKESTISEARHVPESQPSRPSATTAAVEPAARGSALPEPAGEGRNPSTPVPPKRNQESGVAGPLEVRVRAEDAGVLGNAEVSATERPESDRSERAGDAAHPPARREGRRPERSGDVTTGADGEPVESSPPEPVEEAQATTGKLRNARNFRIEDNQAEEIGSGGDKTKINANLDAIELLKRIEKQERIATPEEQAKLARYVDFGGLRKVWDRPWEFHDVTERMEKLLTPEEIAAIKETSLNTHYTSLPVVDAVWKAAKRLGFTGGRILEPGMGIGNFFGRIPKGLAGKSHLMGIEKNIVSGRMAQVLYPDAKVVIKPYEQVQMPNDSMDMIIGNPPFADIKIFDPLYKNPKLAVHNYFIVKSLDKLKSGGIAALITSHYTLDSQSNTARQEMFKRADLVGAIRLPNNAFKKNAGTEVTTDILFFRKRMPGELDKNEPAFDEPWLNTVDVPIGNGSAHINEYFQAHPEMVLGAHSLEGSMYGKDEYTVKANDGDLAGQLKGAIGKLPSDVFGRQGYALPIGGYQGNPDAGLTDPANLAPLDVKDNAFFVEDGKVWMKHNGARTELPEELNKLSTRLQLKDAIALRDALKDTIRVQMESAESDTDLKAAQNKLGTLYDKYRAKYGPLTGPKTAKAFSDDPEYPLLTALENIDPESKAVSKADIFTKRTARPYQPLRDLPEDSRAAMLKVLAEKGKLDTALMANLLKKSEQEVIDSLAKENLIYRDPISGTHVTADEYLSGNVRVKLKQAEAAAELDPEFEKNAKALKDVQPEPIKMADIDARLGQTWIPTKFYHNFIFDALSGGGYTRDLPNIARDHEGRWTVELPSGYNRYELLHTWSGGDIAGHKLVEYALNQQQPSVYFPPDSEGRRELDAPRTAAARQKLQEIKDKFSEWIKGDRLAKHHAELEEKYNDTFNGVRLRDYSGAHLEFPGLNPDYKPRPYQASAVWRIVQEGRALLDHFVGAGKTLTMMSSGMELRRMGLSRKNLYVVPNNMVPQWREDFKRGYPGANVLAVTDQDLSSAKNRRRLFSRIATNEWDAVIVPHSQFNMLPISPERETLSLNKQKAELEEILDDLKSKKGGDQADKRTLRQIENAKQKYEQRLKELSAGRKDNTIYYDDLGVDQMFIDEAHAYKALPFATKMGNISGLSNRRSQRAQNVLAKIEYMFDTHKGRGVVFATGTPITNTVGEQFLMTKYLAPDLLEKAGIRHFDDWAANFATAVTRMEYSTDGVTIKPKTSLSEYVNVPELQQLWSQFADVIGQDTAVKAGYLELPKPDRRDILVKVTPEQEPMLQQIAERGEKLMAKRGPPQKGEDNWLKLDTDSRDISLDARFYDPGAKDDPGSKASRTAEIVKDVLDRTKADRGTVLVVADRYESSKSGFNIFKDMKQKLVAQGVPAHEIAIVHDYPKRDDFTAMQAAMRAGKLRVLFGTTEKVGVGLNVQNKLKALVHLDLPQRPDQVTQREGRIIRHGNQFKDVEIYRLISEPRSVESPKAHDLQRAQLLERKQTFLTQFKEGGRTGRHMEDVAGDVKLSPQMFAIAKAEATGNPMAMEKIKLEHELKGLSLLNRAYTLERHRNAAELERAQMMLASLKSMLPDIRDAVDSFRKNEVRDKEGKLVSFKLDYNGKSFEKLKDANDYLKANPELKNGTQLAINGVDVPLGDNMYKFAGEWHDLPRTEKGEPAGAQSLVSSVLARARNLEVKLGDTEGRIADRTQHIAKLKKELEKKSPYEEKIKQFESRLSEVEGKLLQGVKPAEDLVDAEASDPDEAPALEEQEAVEGTEAHMVRPGARLSSTGNETGLNDIQQLTASIAANAPKKYSLRDRFKIGAKLGEEAGKAHGAIGEALGKVKGFTSALWDAYRNPRSSVLLPRGDGKSISDYERSIGNWSYADNASALDLYHFRKAAEKATPDKVRRGAMGIWMEAGGDQAKLEDWASKVDDKYRPVFEAATKLSDSERTIAQNTLNRNEATLAEMQKAGILREGVENYLMHVWSDNPKMIAQVRAQTNFDSLKTKPSFTKQRVIPTYFDGIQMGYTPKDLDYAALTAAHERGLREALAARGFIKELKDGKGSDGRPLVVTNKASARIAGNDGEDPAYFIQPNTKAGDNYADYRTVDHPALRGWRWATEIDGKPVFVQGDFLVHPEIYRHLKNNLGKSAIRNYSVDIGGMNIKPGEIALSVSQGIKHTILSLSRFHKTTLELHALEHRTNPYSNLPELDLNDADQKALVKGGLMVAHYEGMDAFSDGVQSGGALEKLPGVGDWIHQVNEGLFKEFLPRIKMKVGLAALERNRALYGDKFSDEKIAQITAKEMNAAFGGLNYRQLGRNKTAQDTLRLLFMAPDFMEARGKFVAQAVRPEGREQFYAYMLGAAVLYIAARLLNELLDRKAHWDKPFSVVHASREYSLRMVQGDTVDMLTDPARFGRNRLSPVASGALDFAEHKNYFGKHQSAAETAKDELKRNVPIPLQPWIRKSDDTNAQKAAESALRMIGVNVKNAEPGKHHQHH